MPMDATVNDFFNEINQIAPKKHISAQTAEWQECYDELTGYSYYWNTVTDQVTWTAPKSFQPAQNSQKKNTQPKLGLISITERKPPKIGPFSSPNIDPEAKVKIYSLQEDLNNKSNDVLKKKPLLDYSDDEKIELITEYGNSSESEPETKMKDESNVSINDTTINSDEDDDVDLLAKIQQRAQELKKLGGEVPAEVKSIIHKAEEPDTISGFSLVAGYKSDSDSETEDDQNDSEAQNNIVQTNKTAETSHSTLFPIPQPIDVNDFASSTSEQTEMKSQDVISSDFDNKAFKRKRRIGVSLVNNIKKIKHIDDDGSSGYQGLGFKTDRPHDSDDSSSEIQSKYPGFQKGGVMFVKSDIPNESVDVLKVESEIREGDDDENRKTTVKNYEILREKLKFLGEGRASVLPVQIMLIQAETLFVAMEEKGLKLAYLHKWLDETCSELTKLEKEAAPEGWLLQWDRSHKRYFYLNQATGESQWEYPQPDITRCDDAMDISTTPPHQSDESESLSIESTQSSVFGPQLPVDPPLPPSPPKIRVPTPPPPPIISGDKNGSQVSADVPVSSKFVSNENGEPLPPGVDSQDPTRLHKKPKSDGIKSGDVLSSALDSFYSEIAGVSENITSNSLTAIQEDTKTNSEEKEMQQQVSGEQIKKKKKKVKLAQGLTMKKKGVSELVEKWKNVQKSYGD